METSNTKLDRHREHVERGQKNRTGFDVCDACGLPQAACGCAVEPQGVHVPMFEIEPQGFYELFTTCSMCGTTKKLWTSEDKVVVCLDCLRTGGGG